MKDPRQSKTPADLDEQRWKRSVKKTAAKVRKPEDIAIDINVRVVTQPGMVGLSIGATMKPKEEPNAIDRSKANHGVKKRP